MVSFYEIYRFFYEFQATLSALLCEVVLFSCGFCFNDIAKTKKKKHYFFSTTKSTLILTFIMKLIINLQIYRTLYKTPSTDANPNGKGCRPASKESDKHIYCKKLLWFQFIVYSMD